MLGYIPPAVFLTTGGYNSQSGTRKSYRQALALGGLQTFLVQGVWSQKSAVFPSLCHQEVVKAAKGVLHGRDVRQARSARSFLCPPCPLSSRLGAAPSSSRAGQHTPFPVLHPKTRICCSREAGASPPSELSLLVAARGSVRWGGSHRRPQGKAHTQSTRHHCEQHSFFGAASSLLGQTSCPWRVRPGSKFPHPRGRAAFEARSSRRCSPSGSCGCRTCRRTPCPRRRGSCST